MTSKIKRNPLGVPKIACIPSKFSILIKLK